MRSCLGSERPNDSTPEAPTRVIEEESQGCGGSEWPPTVSYRRKRMKSGCRRSENAFRPSIASSDP
jgi:hypothetical protein